MEYKRSPRQRPIAGVPGKYFSTLVPLRFLRDTVVARARPLVVVAAKLYRYSENYILYFLQRVKRLLGGEREAEERMVFTERSARGQVRISPRRSRGRVYPVQLTFRIEKSLLI